MAAKTTTLAPPSLSTVLRSNTVAPAPAPVATTSTPTTSTSSNASKLAAIKAANQAKQNTIPMTELDSGGFSSGVSDLERDYISMGNAGPSYGVSSLNDYKNVYGKQYSDAGQSIKPVTTPTTTPRTPTPVSTSETINGVKKTYVPRVNTKSFTDTIGKSRSRAEYNTGIGYDTLDEQSKKIADRYYTQAEKTGKLLPPKDMYENREDTIKEEKKKEEEYYDKEIARQKEAEADALAAENLFIDTQTADVTNERDKFVAEQEKLATDTESNRLNQVRGNIMQVLASRGVDISKLSPEQMVALSGEQGAKAFMDITDVREKTKANIKQARDTALSRLNDLRQRKAISTSAYEKNVANINSQAEAAKLNADKNASSQIFALTQTKTEQGRTDSTQRANAVTNIASMLGLSGSQIAPVLNLINTAGTGPEQLVEIAKLIADKNSDLRKSLDANMTASQQASLQKQLLDTYKAETARISATRARSSGGSDTETVTV